MPSSRPDAMCVPHLRGRYWATMRPGDATWTVEDVLTGPPVGTWRSSIVILVGLVAFVLRLLVVMSHGGLLGQLGNDPGVYFTGAAALTFGRIPYLDFYFVHPPVILLILTPFAWLARLTTDPIGFAAANVFSMMIGAVNAVLVARVGWRATDDFPAAVSGGLFYAVWFGAIGAEFSARLEPFGTLFFLAGFALFQSSWPKDRPSRSFAAGVFFGLAVLTKIWWSVPVLTVLGWRLLGERAWRTVLASVVGGLGVAAVTVGPFLSLTGSSMWTMVVEAQLGRGESAARVFDRLVGIAVGQTPGLWQNIAAVAAYACFIWYAVWCWKLQRLRPILVTLAAQLLILLIGPSWFGFYTGYIGAPLALIVAGGAATWRLGRRHSSRSRWVALMMPTLIAATVTTVNLAQIDYVQPIQGRAQVAAALATETCITSDDPTALIQVDGMTRGLAAGCPNWVDITAPRMVHPDLGVPGSAPKWLDTLTHYLSSGDAIVLTGRPLGLRPTDIAELAGGREVTSLGEWRVFIR